MTLPKVATLCLAGACLSSVALANSSVARATLKDLQTVGTTTKQQKKQQYDLIISTPDNEYTCRSRLGETVKPTEFPVGTALQFKLKGQNGEAINSAGKHVKCGVVRVAAAPPAQ